MNLVRLALPALIAVVYAHAANAQLIVYDPFPIGGEPGTNAFGYYNHDERADSSHNRNVGSADPWEGEGNWLDNWSTSGSSRFIVREETLTYSNNDLNLITSGGKLGRGINSQELTRHFAPSDAMIDEGTLYFSFLLHTSPDETYGYGYGITRSGGSSDHRPMFAGVRVTNSGFNISYANGHMGGGNYGFSGGLPTYEPNPDETYFFVARVDINDSMTLWLNPGLGKTETEVDADEDYGFRWHVQYEEASGMEFNRFVARHGGAVDDEDNFTNNFMEVDEVRIAQVSDEFSFADAWAAVTPVSSPLGDPGDVNLDGNVDRLDVLALLHGYGRGPGALWTDGDMNLDGRVDLHDLAIVQNNFGFTTPPAELAAVPEPSSLLLAAAAALAVLLVRRRHK